MNCLALRARVAPFAGRLAQEPRFISGRILGKKPSITAVRRFWTGCLAVIRGAADRSHHDVGRDCDTIGMVSAHERDTEGEQGNLLQRIENRYFAVACAWPGLSIAHDVLLLCAWQRRRSSAAPGGGRVLIGKDTRVSGYMVGPP